MSPKLLFASGLLDLQVTPERWRIWGIRGAVSILDQGLTSGAGFLVNLLLARWLSIEAYGAFAVAFATFLFISGFHSAVLLEPTSIVGPANYAARMPEYLFCQLKIHLTFATILSALVVLSSFTMSWLGINHELVWATAGIAMALPFVLLHWLVRRMCYVMGRPALAAWGSAVYLAATVVGVFVARMMGRLTPFSALQLMATAGAAAALFLLWQLGLLQRRSTSCSLKVVLVENWNYGRWILGSAVLYAIVGQAQTYMAAAFLGLGAAGVLRAVQIPALVMTQIVTAVGFLMLPSMAREFGLGRIDTLKKKALLSTSLLTAMALAYMLLLALFARPIERLLFGGRFSGHAWLIPVLALVPVCTGFAMGFSMALRGSQKPHYDFLANAASAPVALISGVFLIKTWGLGGAAVSVAAGFATYALMYLYSYKAWSTKATIGDSSTRGVLYSQS